MNLKFWEKKNDIDLPPIDPLGSDPLASPGLSSPGIGTPGPGLGTPSFPDPLASNPARDMGNPLSTPSFSPPPGAVMTPAESSPDPGIHNDLIIAKLDAIKTQIETLGQRISNLETKLESGGPHKGPWYTK